jgi:pseudouridine synthase
MRMRLQRFLAQAGVASRRKAEDLITAGRVRVNGQVVTALGSQIDPDRDKIMLGHKRLLAERPIYVLLYKPRGYVTTVRDPEGRPTVMSLLRHFGARIFPVGRLDFQTEGLLVCTNDGDLAHALMHPKHEIEKTYEVKLQGLAGADVLRRLGAGVTLDDGSRTAPARVRWLGDTGKNSWLEISIVEGKNRQIHRMAEALGYRVLKLTRTGYAGLGFGELGPGQSRLLSSQEVATLRRRAGGGERTFVELRKRAPPPRRRRH